MPAATAKIKLPSISELTSLSMAQSHTEQVTLPGPIITPQSLLPVLLQQPPRPNYTLSLELPQIHPPITSYYSYQPGPQNPPPLHYHQLHYYVPVYYPSPPMVSPPHVKQNPDYRVPEVINRPMNKCHRCGTTETPEWRRGPNGLRTLCNACGLFHAKLVRRKGAAWAAEEVLNNKVCKGKNGRRISVKKQAMDESKKRMKQREIIEIPPLPYQLGLNSSVSPPSSHTPVLAASASPVYQPYPVYR